MIEPNLEQIAARLEGLEETIIARFIDRAQFFANAPAYTAGASGFPDAKTLSLLDLRLRYQEEMDAVFGRFCVPEERPFGKNLPAPGRAVSLPENCLAIDTYNRINLTDKIFAGYRTIVSTLCEPGDDGQYGSSVEMDIFALQALSRRIHFGSFYVAESKYRGNPVEYRRLIDARDTNGLMNLLTRKEVEDRIIERIRSKVTAMQAQVNRATRRLISADAVAEFYFTTVIPLTKEGEIAYLYNRRA